MLTAEQLLAVPDADQVTETVELPGLGQVRIKAFSKAEHTRMLRLASDDGGQIDSEKLEALALVYGLAEPQLTQEQATALLSKSWGPVQRLLSRIWALSGMNTFGQVTEAAVEEAERSFRN